MMRKETKTVIAGRSAKRFGGAVNPPVVRTSTVLAQTLAEWEKMDEPGYDGLIYGRLGTSTVWSLESAIAEIEGGAAAFAFSSGLAANVGAILPFLSAGDHILVTDTVYGPVRRFIGTELSRVNISATYYDPSIGVNIGELIRDNTKVVYVEAPGSLTLEMQDIPAIAAVAHKSGLKVVMDNTWATPLYFSPFEHGVDISVHSATKYIVGHSDAMMGIVTANDECAPLVKRCRQNFGQIASPDDSYLAQRGLRTMHVRLERHARTALKLASWIREQPEVATVNYPALDGDAGHELWKRDFKGACGLFTVLMKKLPNDAIRAFMDGLELFNLGASWGGFESLVMPVHPEKVRTAVPWAHDGAVIRFHAGLEHEDDLLADIAQAFAMLRKIV